MAAAVSSSAILDLKTQATFPIRLGNSISKSSSSTRFASVRYNYRPKLKNADGVKASIEDGEDVGEHKLLVEAADGEYQYAGKCDQQDTSFVLVLRGEGKDREMILERLDGSHSFNLVGTPVESDAAKLATKHPHLPAGAPEEDDLFGDDDLPPDDSNPFDFRHFLKTELEKPQDTELIAESSRSMLGTSLVQHTPPTVSLKKPAKPAQVKVAAPKKRKTPATEKVNPKRVKAGEEPAPVVERPKPKAKTEAPKIRIDRKASVIRKSSIEDDGELILENETPTSEKPPHHRGAMALALSGQLAGGPISLRSAASSPGLASPAPEKEEEAEVQEYEFEFGNSSSPEPDEGGGDADVDLDGEDDDDADVDDLELPSPAQKRPSVPGIPPIGGDDEEDDIEKQLALAMAADDSEESEEE